MGWSGKTARGFDRKLCIGAVLLAVLAVLNLVVAGQPWGVVYGFGLWFGKIATVAGVFDPATNPFWSQPVNMANLSQSVFMDVTSITNRSEEHTSELQSLMRISYAVFCLKKKNTS